MTYVYEMERETTWHDYYAEAYACQIEALRIEAQMAEAEQEEEDAVWAVVEFIAGFERRAEGAAVEAVFEALSGLSEQFRSYDDLPF